MLTSAGRMLQKVLLILTEWRYIRKKPKNFHYLRSVTLAWTVSDSYSEDNKSC